MISLKIILILIWTHFISDFVFQNDEMAMNKSKDVNILCYHCIFYTVPFIILEGFGYLPLGFSVVNCLFHLLTDFITSKITKKLYTENKRYLFFLVVGLDQAIHYTTLFLTYLYLKGSL